MSVQDVIDFMIIDDDPLNNYVCSRYLKIVFPNNKIEAYTEPLKALSSLRERYRIVTAKKMVIFLDINMPGLNGWEVLEQIEQFDENIRKKLSIYIVSSSVDAGDRQKARDNPLVTGYIEKPFSLQHVEKMKGIF